MEGGLARRLLVAVALLAVIIGSAFAVLLSSVSDLHQSERRAQQSEQVLVDANALERVVLNLETGERGFAITGQEALLQPWQDARSALPARAEALQDLVEGNPEQAPRVRRIIADTQSYLRDYSIPLVTLARRDRAAAQTAAVTDEGSRRTDAIRAEFDELFATERTLARTRQDQVDLAAQRAAIAAAAGLGGSVVLLLVFAGYLIRAIIQPVRRVAAMAGRLAGGDLSARLSERGVGDIGVLQRAFNAMAGSLQRSRDELAASRARIVAVGDQTRRRIERDLHDGTQQRLVSLVLDLHTALATAPHELTELRAQLDGIIKGLSDVLDELRELSRGIHPAVLSVGGLAPALKALARRSSVPVELTMDVPHRLPEPVEVAAYYVVSEALANVAKHARASLVHVDVRATDGGLRLSVADDGVGGADPGRGSGLVGLTDRVHAQGGTIVVDSPPGEGTTLRVDLPSADGRRRS